MARNLHSSTIAALNNDSLEMFYLLTFYFSSTFRLTNYAHDISYDFGSGNETFLSTGRISSTGSITETQEIGNPTINITLTGANSADIALALTENFNNRRVLIRRGFFDSSGNTTDANIIPDPFIIFDGRVDSYEIADNPSKGESAVTWKISSHWADWEKVNGRKCNPENAKQYFPTETGFDHVYDQIGERTWGRIRS